MTRTKLQLHFRSKLILIQFFLVVPLITILIFVIIFLIRTSVTKELDNSHIYSLHTAGGAFDRTYNRARKLLEIPYTEKTMYNILTTEYGPENIIQKMSDPTVVSNIIYASVLYYEPSITSVTIVSEISDSVYFNRSAPTNSVNVHNPDWYNLQQSAWYKETVALDDPVFSPARENELYLRSGITVSLSQRLKDVFRDRRIGAIRIDLNLNVLSRDWAQVSENEKDTFVVLDHTGQLVYANSPAFLEKYPLLTVPKTAEWQNNYRISSYTAPVSKFTFLYLADASFPDSNIQLLYGIPLLFAVFSIAYSILFISWSSQHISRPVQKLKTAMIQGQQKDLSVRCEPLGGEMGVLSEAFNDLMDQVGTLISEVASGEREKARMSYEMLQSKISPHFLYNTMNAIRWKADLLGAREISLALESLISLLRFSIKSTLDIIPFSQELEQLENYIQIMRVRYGSDIDISYDIDEACLDYQCLKFLFQTVVENCFIHAFINCDARQKNIYVQAFTESEHIRIVIEDNGSGMTKQQIETLFDGSDSKGRTMFAGIGIGNLRQRIRLLFGPEYDLQIDSELGIYTKVTAVIPKLTLEDIQNDNIIGR